MFSSEDTVRITVAKLDARLVEAEEMLTAKLTTGQRAEDLRELARPFEAWRNEWAVVEPDARALRQSMDRPAPGHPPSRGLARLLEFFDRSCRLPRSRHHSQNWCATFVVTWGRRPNWRCAARRSSWTSAFWRR